MNVFSFLKKCLPLPDLICSSVPHSSQHLKSWHLQASLSLIPNEPVSSLLRLHLWVLSACPTQTFMHTFLISSPYCLIFLTIVIYLLYIGGVTQASMQIRRQLIEESVLSFHHIGSKDQTQVVRLSSKCFCLLSHLSGASLQVISGTGQLPC